ncbi:MAG: hypothetical protein U0802_21040 [Candidatus Binatia bacterium]
MSAPRRLLVATLAALLAGPSAERAAACGGPAVADLAAYLVPLDTDALVSFPDQMDFTYRDELLFLYPFRLALGDSFEPMWQMAYDWNWQPSGIPAVDLAPFEAAVAAHHWPAAAAAANAVVTRILDLPRPVAQRHNDALRRAVEFLELVPFVGEAGDPRAAAYFLSWGGVPAEVEQLPPTFRRAAAIRAMPRADAARVLAEDPTQARAASLRFVVIQLALREQIADGWSTIPADAAARIELAIDDWLRDYPQHPLRDLVALQRVRVRYFQQGGGLEAVCFLLDMYPRHQQRVLGELRYIFLNRSFVTVPLDVVENRQPPDPLLLTAMIPGHTSVGPADWPRLWRLSEAHADQPWAINLQERLLRAAGAMLDLPDGYPNAPRSPTPLWGKLRLGELVRRGRWQDALRQAAVTPAGEGVAQLTATAHLALGQIADAVTTPDLPVDARRYLLDTLLSDAELRALLHGPFAAAAAQTLGIRQAVAGDWAAAARTIAPFDAARAALWREAAQLSRDTSSVGRLRWARFLAARRGDLFRPTDTAWERSLGWSARWPRTTTPRRAWCRAGRWRISARRHAANCCRARTGWR